MLNLGIAFAPLVAEPVLWAAIAAAVVLALDLVRPAHGAAQLLARTQLVDFGFPGHRRGAQESIHCKRPG